MHTEGTTSSQERPALRREVLLVALDLAAFGASVTAALLLRFGFDAPWEHTLPYLYFWPLLFGWRLLMARTFGLYDFRHKLTMTDHAFSGAGAALAGVGLGYLFFLLIQLYALELTRVSRVVVGLDIVLTTGWFALSRGVALALLRRRGYRVNILLLGPAERCGRLADEIRAYAPKLVSLAGVCALDDPPENGDTANPLAEWDSLIEQRRVQQVVLAEAELPQKMLRDLLATCDRFGTEPYLYPALDLALLAEARVRSLGGVPLISLRPANTAGLYGPAKRGLDVLTALLLATITFPVWLCAAAAVKLTSPGPLLFSQERTGRNGRSFRIFKFRTMKANDGPEPPPTLSGADDARITKAGRLLRKWRIDEIPQLWNVLRGDMSLVGPRPERCELVEQFTAENPLYERRHLVRPGLTGLAQIHGRYDTDYTHKLRYDLMYINSVSFALDLRILVATVQTVLTGRGAM